MTPEAAFPPGAAPRGESLLTFDSSLSLSLLLQLPVLRAYWQIFEKAKKTERKGGLMSEEGARFTFETFSVDFKHKLKLCPLKFVWLWCYF